MDIFRERKKKRKQEKKKRQLSPTQDGGRGDAVDNNAAGDSHAENLELQDASNQSRGEVDESGIVDTEMKIVLKESGKESDSDVHEFTEKGTGDNGLDALDPKQSKENVQVQPEKTTFIRDSCNGFRRPRSSPSPPLLPPGLRASPDPVSSLGDNSSTPQSRKKNEHRTHSTRLHVQAPCTPDPSRLSLNDSQQKSTSISPKPNLQLPQKLLAPNTEAFSCPLPPSDALFITVPHNERPDPLPGEALSSLAVPAARHFIDTYYTHFSLTSPIAQIHDLARYYTSKAQKSVSIGGAHSVVTGRRDIAAQISNFAGAAFVVRGVVAQDAVDGKGVHILVTGTAVTSSGAVRGVLANFAHSISLTPINTGLQCETGANCPALAEALEIGFPFQIHNDALALLSGDAPMTPLPISQPPPMQQPPLPPPPPGLF